MYLVVTEWGGGGVVTGRLVNRKTETTRLSAVTTHYTCGEYTQKHTHMYKRHSHSQNHTKVHNKNTEVHNKNTEGHIAETLEQTERDTQSQPHNYTSNITPYGKFR